MTDIVCETVTVTVTDESGNTTALEVPAYTVSREALCSRIAEITEDYMRKSGDAVSLGDFALYCLTQAKGDPRTVSAEEVNPNAPSGGGHP